MLSIFETLIQASLMTLPLSRNSLWVFIGDSITDGGRRQCPEEVGSGYVRQIRDWLRASAPGSAPQIVNKGISGNTISDLQRRWESDVIDEQPQLVSIKIGMNDVLHGLRWRGTPIARFSRSIGILTGSGALVPTRQSSFANRA